MEIGLVITDLLSSPKLFSETDRFSDKPGIYALSYSGESNTIGSFQFCEKELLYIGKTESSQISRDVKTHFNSGKTGSSTVRRSLGAILLSELSLKPIPRNTTDYQSGRFSFYKFDDQSEELLTKWMKDYIAISFFEFLGTIEDLDSFETSVIQRLTPPLNIQKNPYNPYGTMLKGLRKCCAEIARRTVQQPIRVIEKKTGKKSVTSKGGNKMGKYSDFWRRLLPRIEEKLTGAFEKRG